MVRRGLAGSNARKAREGTVINEPPGTGGVPSGMQNLVRAPEVHIVQSLCLHLATFLLPFFSSYLEIFLFYRDIYPY